MIAQGVNPDWVTDELLMYQESVQKFLDAELVPNMEKWRSQEIVDRDFWNKAGDQGILGACVPEEYGGSGMPMSYDYVSLLEQGRRGDTNWGLAIQSIVTHYIVGYGTEEQKQRWLPKIASGEYVTSLAMTEPGTGSDVQSIKTTAEKEGNCYKINGSKTFITNGQSSDLIVVAVKTDKSLGSKGVSLVVLETEDLEGFTRGRNLEKLGMKGNDTSELFFEDVKVPLTNLLGHEEGQGFYQLMKQLPWERLTIGVTAIGFMDYIIGETVAYTQQRKAFKQRVMDFQNTRFKLAECKTKLEVTRSFINDCVGRLEQGKLDAATASMAKYWASDVQNEVVDECLQLFGGYGYMMEYPIAHAYADSRVQRIYGGTNEIMKELIARSIDV